MSWAASAMRFVNAGTSSILNGVGLKTGWTIVACLGGVNVAMGAVFGVSWLTVLGAFLLGVGLQGIQVAILLRRQCAMRAAFRVSENERLETLNVVSRALGESLTRERELSGHGQDRDS